MLCNQVKTPFFGDMVNTSEEFKWQCFTQCAIGLKDPTLCTQVPDDLGYGGGIRFDAPGHNRDVCYSSFTNNLHDVSLCSKMGSYSDKCYTTIADFKNDSVICENVLDQLPHGWTPVAWNRFI